MKLREEEFYEQYHQHGGTTIIPTEIFNELYDDATEEIERLKDLCNKYEEEHKTAFEEWKKAINIINELEKWLDKKEKLTFNSWNKGIHEVQRKLQELKGSGKE